MKIKPTGYQIQVFEKAGCEYVRTKGDHLIYKEIPVFVIRNNMKIIGMTREEYIELLCEV